MDYLKTTKTLIVIAALGLTSCRRMSLPKATIDATTVNLLSIEYHAKMLLLDWDKDTGWPDPHNCDGLLWAGLAKAAGVSSVNLTLAEKSPGRLDRRPGLPCYPVESKSTISRDMVLGYLWGTRNDSNALNRLFDYGNANAWVMGDPFPEAPGDVFLTGNLVGLIARMRCGFGSCNSDRFITPAYGRDSTDYVQHLTALFIILDQIVSDDTYRQPAKETADWLYSLSPNDALISYAYHSFGDGDQTPTAQLLMGDYTPPPYVRDSPNYADVHWLFVANLILRLQ